MDMLVSTIGDGVIHAARDREDVRCGRSISEKLTMPPDCRSPAEVRSAVKRDENGMSDTETVVVVSSIFFVLYYKRVT